MTQRMGGVLRPVHVRLAGGRGGKSVVRGAEVEDLVHARQVGGGQWVEEIGER